MDDAYLESHKVVGVGTMLGYSNGQFIVGMTKTKHWVSSPKHAEVLALKEALSFISHIVSSQLIIETAGLQIV